MKHPTANLTALALATLMIGCPILRPRDDETTDAADEDTPTSPAETSGASAKPSESGSTESDGGQPPLACEDELEQVRAELNKCLAGK